MENQQAETVSGQRFLMHTKRVIARLDIKNEYVIKGIHLEGLRKIGDPNEMAFEYYQQRADEIILMDAVAAYYDRNSLDQIISKATENIFIPITVGGGVRSVDDISRLLRSGADKVALNTQAIKTPELITQAARVFGSQCIVASIEAKRGASGGWEAYIENGREPTGRDVMVWAKEVVDRGAGEILVTSVDQEGTRKGYDLELMHDLSQLLPVPVVASGGAGSCRDVVELFSATEVEGAAMAACLHYQDTSIADVKMTLGDAGVAVRS